MVYRILLGMVIKWLHFTNYEDETMAVLSSDTVTFLFCIRGNMDESMYSIVFISNIQNHTTKDPCFGALIMCYSVNEHYMSAYAVESLSSVQILSSESKLLTFAGFWIRKVRLFPCKEMESRMEHLPYLEHASGYRDFSSTCTWFSDAHYKNVANCTHGSIFLFFRFVFYRLIWMAGFFLFIPFFWMLFVRTFGRVQPFDHPSIYIYIYIQ